MYIDSASIGTYLLKGTTFSPTDSKISQRDMYPYASYISYNYMCVNKNFTQIINN